jgi:hypothetical protein
MTERKESGRSPTEFYEQDAGARLLWDFLEEVLCRTGDVVRFYRRHKVIGNTHYTEYIDTMELLKDDTAHAKIVEGIRDKLSLRNIVPSILFIPARTRARLLARLLADAFEMAQADRVEIVEARYSGSNWIITDEQARMFKCREVVVVDTAIGHGRTIDDLAHLARMNGAQRVGTAVILSRLSEGCEEAFDARLTGGFHRLFNLPIRPVVIRGADRTICPVCQQRAAISHIAHDADAEAIE